MRVLVTGATGFVGRTLCKLLAQRGYVVRAALRTDRPVPTCVAERAVVGEISAATDWTDALAGVDKVIHLAARVHIMNDSPSNAELYVRSNALGTDGLARACLVAGVERLVFMSSIKVNGEQTDVRPYSALDVPQPSDPYAASKLQGEQFAFEAGRQGKLDVVIIRPPLIYGPGVGANFMRLMQWVHRGVPMPFGAIRNSRSVVSIWNLCDFLLLCLEHPAAVGHVWLVSDGEDLSTPDLIQRMACQMGRKARLWSVPPVLLRAIGRLTGRQLEVARLCGSLEVNIEPARHVLEWSPPVSVDDGLARTTRWYLAEDRSRFQ